MKHAIKWLYSLPLFIGIVALYCGGSEIHLLSVINEIGAYIAGGEISTDAMIVLDIRLPRIVLALLVGASLSGSGALMQAVFKNPLVDPFLLGISSGAILGCALSIGLFPAIPTQILAFIGALLCAFAVLFIAHLAGGGKIALVLSGVVLSAFLSAMTGLIKYFVDPYKVQTIVLWLLGSLSLSSWNGVAIVLIGLVIGFLPIYFLSWRINILSLDDVEAQTLGMSPHKMRAMMIILVSFSCALAVSLSGIIGWVGLLTPHIARFIVGPQMQKLIPASLCLGGVLLLIADTIARSATPYDLPVGVVTAVLGAPFFILLLKRAKANWN